MQIDQQTIRNEQWVIWNGSLGIADIVTIGEIETTDTHTDAWLEEPYEMVGPFDLNALLTEGKIDFAACSVMSIQKWADDQVVLQRESRKLRHAAQKRLFEKFANLNQNNNSSSLFAHNHEGNYRARLDLPSEGKLTTSEIKSAFRKLAQKVHPDMGGSQEEFILITEAKEALLKLASHP